MTPRKPKDPAAPIWQVEPPPTRRTAPDGARWCATCDTRLGRHLHHRQDFCPQCSARRVQLSNSRKRLRATDAGRRFDRQEMEALDAMVAHAIEQLIALWKDNRPPNELPTTPVQALRIEMQEGLANALEPLIEARRLVWLDAIEQHHRSDLRTLQDAVEAAHKRERDRDSSRL